MLFRRKIVYIIILFVCFSTLLHAGENENKAIYDKAQKIIDDYTGDTSLLKRAYKLLDKIAIANPNSKYVLVGYGRIAYKSGYINYGNYDKSSLEKSKVYFEKAISIDSKFFDAYFYGTYPYLFSKDYEKAKQMIGRANALSPNSARIDVLFGEIAKNEKDYNAVIKHAKSAIEKRPNSKILVDSYSLLSSAYKIQKRYDLADSSYQEIINIKPESPWARVNYSSFLREYRKDYDRAIEQGKIALELMDFGMGHKVLGDAYYAKAAQLHWEKKRYKESIKYFLHAIEHNPSKSNALYGLGISYYRIGHKNKDKSQIIQAEKYLDKAIQVNPDHKQAIEQLAEVRKLLSWLGK